MDVMNEILRLKATTRSFGQGIEIKKKKKDGQEIGIATC